MNTYYILIESQKNDGTISATPICYEDLATAKEAYFEKARYTPKTTAEYMGVMLLRHDGALVMPVATGPETK